MVTAIEDANEQARRACIAERYFSQRGKYLEINEVLDLAQPLDIFLERS